VASDVPLPTDLLERMQDAGQLPKPTRRTPRRAKPSSASATSTAEVGQDAGEAVKARKRRAPRPPTGKSECNRKSEVDPVERFRQLATAYEKAEEPKGECEKELSRFLAELSDADEQAIRKWWAKLLKAEQDKRFEIFNALGGVFGPAAKLMHEIYEDGQAFKDKLPTPSPAVDPKWAEEQTVAILRTFLPEDKAREIAAEPRPSEEDVMREALQRVAISILGDTPEAAEAAEAALVEHSRQGKWMAVCDAVEPAEAATKAHARNEELRTLAPQIAKLADTAAQDLPALLVTPGNAATVRDQVLLPLFRALEGARLAADSVLPAAWLVDCIANGEPRTADEVVRAARDLAAVAKEAQVLSKRLRRPKKRPLKPAVDAAVALTARGLDPRQIATVLDRKDLRLDPDPHTPENVRRAVRNRLKRSRADTK